VQLALVGESFPGIETFGRRVLGEIPVVAVLRALLAARVDLAAVVTPAG
jgi:hypothetical protein